MLRLANLHKRYQNGGKPLHVLKGINLSVAVGEFLAVMGHSGSGKSTLLNILELLDHFSYSFPTPDEIDIAFAPERKDQPECRQFWLIRPNTTHKMAVALKSDRAGAAHTITMRNVTPLSQISEAPFCLPSKSGQLN